MEATLSDLMPVITVLAALFGGGGLWAGYKARKEGQAATTTAEASAHTAEANAAEKLSGQSLQWAIFFRQRIAELEVKFDAQEIANKAHYQELEARIQELQAENQQLRNALEAERRLTEAERRMTKAQGEEIARLKDRLRVLEEPGPEGIFPGA